MFLWNANTTKAAPAGAASFLALAAVAVSCVSFSLFMQLRFWTVGRWVAAFLIVVAYLLYPAAVAFSIYSTLFESSKLLGLAGLALAALVAALTFLTVPFFLDGLLLLPFWFLAAMCIIKFIKWRNSRQTHLTRADS